MSDYSDSFLNDILCGFRNAHSTQQALFELLQSWQHVLDNGGFISTILMDLSKECYGVDKASLRLLLDYFDRRKQRQK